MCTMIEMVLSAVTLALCVLLLLRLALGRRRRQRLDDAAYRAWWRLRRIGHRMLHWRASRKEAARAAEAAIRRARDGVQRDGNVYKPRSFREPRKPH
ncbi:MAG TPA: hypothetical protein VE029_11075 [Rhizobacter sp.]|nr:hypothetical protein [Rhizobacter sp.]